MNVSLSVQPLHIQEKKTFANMKVYSRQEVLSLYSSQYPPSPDLADANGTPFVSSKPIPPVAQIPLSHVEEELSSNGEWVITAAGAGGSFGGGGTLGARKGRSSILKPLVDQKDDNQQAADDFTVVGYRGKASNSNAAVLGNNIAAVGAVGAAAAAAGGFGKPVSRSAIAVERDFNSSWRRKDDDGEGASQGKEKDILDNSQIPSSSSSATNLGVVGGAGGGAPSVENNGAFLGGLGAGGGVVGYPPGMYPEPVFRAIPRSWWYQDFHGVIQGPFSSDQMKNWYAQGFIPHSLPVRSSEHAPFVFLQDLFLLGDKAFLDFLPPLSGFTAPVSSPAISAPLPEPVALHQHSAVLYSAQVQPSLQAVSFNPHPGNSRFLTEIDNHLDDHAFARVVDHVLVNEEPPASLVHVAVVESPVAVAQAPAVPSPIASPVRESSPARQVVQEKSKQKKRGKSPAKTVAPVIVADLIVDAVVVSPETIDDTAKTQKQESDVVVSDQYALVGKKVKNANKKAEKVEKPEKSKAKRVDAKKEEPLEHAVLVPEQETHLVSQPQEDANLAAGSQQAALPSWTAKPTHQLSLREIMEKEEAEARKLKVQEEARKYTLAGRIASTKTAWSAAASSGGSAPAAKGLLEIMQEQEKKVQVKPASNMASAIAKTGAPSLPAKSGWASVATSSPSVRSTQQEAEQKRVPAMAPTVSGNSWMVAGLQPKARSDSSGSLSAVPSAKVDADDEFWNPIGVKKSVPVVPAVVPTPGRVSLKNSANGNEFGGPSLPPEFLAWCKKQLTAITGSDDITLISFLTSLNSADAIKDYIYEYLGRSAQVEEFANEFILHKEFVENPSVVVAKKPKAGEEEDFITVGVAVDASKKSKKKKKKKAGAPLV
eukprot:TRINITY_DN30935_c0_g1_i1.p1 TRINITY_DN30935_c0_g1~~TRINITY_DN30935_c0_g1_i1.p1  ORF type:complete len:881 (+),score=310.11 TRINITY_DN30935_c0_g1_i1:1965-4607(+)